MNVHGNVNKYCKYCQEPSGLEISGIAYIIKLGGDKMYVKLDEDQNGYHFCQKHLEELGRLDELNNPDELIDYQYNKPKDLCEKCKSLARNGDCLPLYVEVGSFTDES